MPRPARGGQDDEPRGAPILAAATADAHAAQPDADCGGPAEAAAAAADDGAGDVVHPSPDFLGPVPPSATATGKCKFTKCSFLISSWTRYGVSGGHILGLG